MLSPELRDRLLYYAYRAPSPHNAQGWRIEAEESRFRVFRDPARQVLRELDPHAREGDLACGAAVANLCVGAKAFGFDAQVHWRPAPDVAADVALVAAPAPPSEAALVRLGALRRRAMNRSMYGPEPVPGPFVSHLQDAAEGLGFRLSVLTDKGAIERMAAVAARASAIKLTHQPTQAELHALMRFSARSAAEERDGLDLELFFASPAAARLAAVATHPRALQAAAPVRMAEMIVRGSDAAPLRSSPALCLLYAGSLGEETFLRCQRPLGSPAWRP